MVAFPFILEATSAKIGANALHGPHHSAEKSTLDAIEISSKPIAITHANPSFWFAAKRNKSNEVLKELAKSGGMLGLSLYPHHLKDTSNCTLESFCEMAAQTAELMGIKNIGIGSDLCLKQPNNVVEWMRNGTWTKTKDYGEGSSVNPHFPHVCLSLCCAMKVPFPHLEQTFLALDALSPSTL